MNQQLNGTNKRFIEAVDHILDTHKSMGMDPSTARSLSLLIGRDQNTISRIRKGGKNVSAEQVKRLAALCSLDLNFFYNESIQFHYEPSLFSEENLKRSNEGQVVNMDFNSTGDGNANFQMGQGDFTGTVYNKEVSNSSTSDTHFHFYQAEQLVKAIPVQFQSMLSKELGKIKNSYLQLERRLEEKTEELKKITNHYMEEIRLNRDSLVDVMSQLKKERASKDEIYQSYIDALKEK